MKSLLPVETELETALRILCKSAVVQKARIGTRGRYRITEEVTGETMRGRGPALVLVVNEMLFKQGW